MGTNDMNIEKIEDEFYRIFLTKAIAFAKNPKDANMNNATFRQIVSAAGVMAKQRQTRIARSTLKYHIEKESGSIIKKIRHPRLIENSKS